MTPSGEAHSDADPKLVSHMAFVSIGMGPTFFTFALLLACCTFALLCFTYKTTPWQCMRSVTPSVWYSSRHRGLQECGANADLWMGNGSAGLHLHLHFTVAFCNRIVPLNLKIPTTLRSSRRYGQRQIGTGEVFHNKGRLYLLVLSSLIGRILALVVGRTVSL